MLISTPPKRNLANQTLEPWQDINAVPYIKIDNLSKTYGDISTVKNVSLSIFKGELFSLLGQSGCGKTTLLRMLAGFETPDSGHIIIDGEDITNWPPYQRPVNMMFQSYALFPHMTVSQNIAFGLKQDGLNKTEINERIEEALSLVQLSDFGHRKPHQLSGGQKQRAALARSLAKRPKLMLLDEPLAALDKRLKEQTQFELVNIQERVGITFILVTHDQEEAMTISTRLGIMDDGKIRQVGVPRDVYEFPNSKFVAEFLGSMNMCDGVVADHELDHVLIESPELDCTCYATHTGTLPLGAKVTLAIRPEKIMISKTEPSNQKNCVRGVIKEIAYLGDVSIFYVLLQSGKTILATLPNLLRLSDTSLQWEDDVFLFWRAENSLVLH